MVDMLIERFICKDLWREASQPEIVILTGPRQVGKTTLHRWVEEQARRSGKATRFLDLEQPSDLASLHGGGEEVIAALTRDVDMVFVDDFYYLENAGRIFKAIFDRGERQGRRIKVFASGSSSVEIHGHLQESLAGRTVTGDTPPALG